MSIAQASTQLQDTILRFALAHPTITFTLTNATIGSDLHLPADAYDWRLQAALGSLWQACHTARLHAGDSAHLGIVLASPLCASGATCAQFLSCNGVPIHRSPLHDIIQAAYTAARSGTRGKGSRSAASGGSAAFVARVSLPADAYTAVGPGLERSLILHSHSPLPRLVYQV